MLGLSFFLSLDWCSYIISIAKIVPKKTGALTGNTTFLLKLPFISTNLPYVLAWNTVVTSRLVLLTAQGLFQKVRVCVRFFQKKGKKGQTICSKRAKKYKIFESLGKHVQNLKMFLKRAGDCMQLSHAINCQNRLCCCVLDKLQKWYGILLSFLGWCS